MKTSNRKRVVAVVLLALGGCLLRQGYAADPLVPNAATMLEFLESPIKAPALHVGPFDIHPRASAGVSYDDNILVRANDPQADVIWTFSPGISAVANNISEGYGTSLALAYDLSLVDFRHHNNNSSVDHHASLAGQWLMAKLALGLNQTIQRTSTGIIEVGDRLRQTQYSTLLTAHYQLSELTSFDLNPRVTTSDTQGYTGSTDWGGEAFLNRAVSPKVAASLGASGGYIDVQDSPHQTYERCLLRLRYAATGKMNFEANGGGEWRQYHSERTGTFIPVLGIAAAYRPVEATSLTLEAHRRETVSLIKGENYVTSGASLGIRQRLQERCFVTLTGGYENRDYKDAAPGVPAARQDDFYTVRFGIGVTLYKHWTADSFYQYERNNSNQAGHELEDNQVGLRTTVEF
jgi:hypothetical protein